MAIELKAYRASGAQNTFFIFDQEDIYGLEPDKLTFLTKKICSGFYGFQTDGALFLMKHPQGFQWKFFNSDGSGAEMCGNAARCVAAFLDQIKRVAITQGINLFTVVGEVGLNKEGPLYKVGMPKISNEAHLELQGNKIFRVDTGVPHIVLEQIPEITLAKELRWNKQIDARGSNVTFVEVKAPERATAVTFERGVESFTRACGTGAVAAAKYLVQKSPQLNRFFIDMPGGNLQVEFNGSAVDLIGPAQIDFEIKFDAKSLGLI